MHPTQVAESYFASVRARNIDNFTALFAEDAVFVKPDGHELSGLAAIREMELGVFNSSSPPAPSPTAMVVGDSAIAVEIDVHLPDGTVRRVANFFSLDAEGRIKRVSVYRKG